MSSPEPDLSETSRILLKKAEEEATGIEVSLDRDRLAVLTQYAVPFRYDELLDAKSLEREVGERA